MNTNKSFVIAATVLLLAACQSKEISITLDDVNDEQNVEAGIPAPDITAIQEVQNNTKSTLEVDGLGVGTIYWTPADEINVFYGTTSTHYTSQNAVNATTAVFTTSDIIGISEGASENIWGLYPYNSSATCTGSAVTTTLPATQYGVPGTFDDDLYITLAHNNSTALTFYNVCGGIKFSLSRDDITQIKFRGNNNEDLAGDIRLNFVDGLPNVSVTSGLHEISLTPKTGSTFVSGQNYYITLLPVVLSLGFTMEFTTSSSQVGIFNFSSSPITIKRSIFSKKADIDTYALFPAPNNQIWYTSTDGNTISPLASAFSASIISNEYTDGKGVITFDDDITVVGTDAFRNQSTLRSIILPESLLTIGESAFRGDEYLENVYIPDGVTDIKAYAFYSCLRLRSVNLPSNLTHIRDYAFADCRYYLSSIVFPETLQYLGPYSFSHCFHLASIHFKAALNPQYAVIRPFEYGDVERVYHVDDLSVWLALGDKSQWNLSGESPTSFSSSYYRLYVNNQEAKKVTIPNGTSLAYGCFYACESIENLKVYPLSGGTQSWAFSYCKNLTTVYWQNSTVAMGMFENCSSLTSADLHGVERILTGAFNGCNLIYLTIPSGVTNIEGRAFANNTSMYRVYVTPSTPPTLGDDAFLNTNNCSFYIQDNYYDYKAAPSWSPYYSRMVDDSYSD